MPPLPPRPRDAHDALVDARDQLRRFRIIMSAADPAWIEHGPRLVESTGSDAFEATFAPDQPLAIPVTMDR